MVPGWVADLNLARRVAAGRSWAGAVGGGGDAPTMDFQQRGKRWRGSIAAVGALTGWNRMHGEHHGDHAQHGEHSVSSSSSSANSFKDDAEAMRRRVDAFEREGARGGHAARRQREEAAAREHAKEWVQRLEKRRSGLRDAFALLGAELSKRGDLGKAESERSDVAKQLARCGSRACIWVSEHESAFSSFGGYGGVGGLAAQAAKVDYGACAGSGRVTRSMRAHQA